MPAPDGALIVGGSESIDRMTAHFAPQRCLRDIFYQLQEHAPEAAAIPTPLPFRVQTTPQAAHACREAPTAQA